MSKPTKTAAELAREFEQDPEYRARREEQEKRLALLAAETAADERLLVEEIRTVFGFRIARHQPCHQVGQEAGEGPGQRRQNDVEDQMGVDRQFCGRKRQLLQEKQPSLQFSTPEQLGALAVFLCSPAGDNVRGVAWQVDGGWTAQ